jgi:hypothetical protein
MQETCQIPFLPWLYLALNHMFQNPLTINWISIYVCNTGLQISNWKSMQLLAIKFWKIQFNIKSKWFFFNLDIE